RQLGWARRSRSVDRQFNAAGDVSCDGAPVQAGAPGNRRDGHPLLVQLQYHDQLRQPDHPEPPPTHRRRRGPTTDAVLTNPAQATLNASLAEPCSRIAKSMPAEYLEAKDLGGSGRDPVQAATPVTQGAGAIGRLRAIGPRQPTLAAHLAPSP